MANQFFLTKSHAVLLEELRGENRLRRVLGPVQLSSLGVGAIIGTGIFVLTGVAAHDLTGPALMLSFVVSGITCVFAALCYAEFASMVPVAGSAYTYAYATLGELIRMDYRMGSDSRIRGGLGHRRARLVALLPGFSFLLPHCIAAPLHERAFRLRSVFRTAHADRNLVRLAGDRDCRARHHCSW